MATDLERTNRPHDAGSLMDALPAGVVRFDDSGRVLYTNATLRSLLGYDAGELDGVHVERLLTVAGRIFYQTHFFPLLRLHGAAREVFLLLRTKTGADVGALVNATRATRDGATAIDCVLMEVQERRKYEEELLRARQSADRANADVPACLMNLRRVLLSAIRRPSAAGYQGRVWAASLTQGPVESLVHQLVGALVVLAAHRPHRPRVEAAQL